MENIKEIYLTDDDILKLKQHEVGHGTDGAVYRMGKNLIKVYHSNLREGKMKLNVPSDDSDIKIYNKGIKIKPQYTEPLNYYQYDGEDVRLRSKTGIKKAIERQANISRTKLPQGVVYYKGNFAGCILQELKGIQIHKLTGLPLNMKKRIMKNVILDVKELMEYYIYHIDLDNSPYSFSAFLNEEGVYENAGHSHVLVNPITGKTNLIDLDGKSTIYTERKSDEYEELTLKSLTELLIEFLLGIDLDDYKDYDDEVKTLMDDLEFIGVMDKYIDKLGKRDLSLEDMENLIQDTTNLKRL